MKKMLILMCLIGLALPTMALADVMADYEANCLKCHSLDAKTNVRWALRLKIDPKKIYLPSSQMNKDMMITIIEKGKGRMPSFEKKLSKEQITDIVDYVLSLREK
ncbi:MAG: c-type cytochrome [Thermodesulfobacteriota bacterium]